MASESVFEDVPNSELSLGGPFGFDLGSETPRLKTLIKSNTEFQLQTQHSGSHLEIQTPRDMPLSDRRLLDNSTSQSFRGSRSGRRRSFTALEPSPSPSHDSEPESRRPFQSERNVNNLTKRQTELQIRDNDSSSTHGRLQKFSPYLNRSLDLTRAERNLINDFAQPESKIQRSSSRKGTSSNTEIESSHKTNSTIRKKRRGSQSMLLSRLLENTAKSNTKEGRILATALVTHITAIR